LTRQTNRKERLKIKRLSQYYSKLPSWLQVLLTPAAAIYLVPRIYKYRTTITYLFKRQKITAVYKFILAKLFVREEGGALLDPFFRLFPRFTPHPWCVEVEITTKCDKRCIICEHTYWNEKGIDLSFDDFKRIVDQFPKLIWFNPTGEGSAFLNKDFPKMLRYLKSKSIFIFMNDHFEMLNEDLIKEIVEIGVDRIEVSMDGATKETYEKIKRGCDFDKVMDNLRTLFRLKKERNWPIPEICFHYIITALNVHEMPQFVELIHSLGDRNVLGPGSYINFSGLLEFDEIMDLIAEVPAEIMKAVEDKAKELNVGIMWTHHSHQERPPISKCVAWSEPYVMMGGYVLSCCGVLMSNRRPFLRENSFGNVKEKPFLDIWDSSKYRRFRKSVNDGSAPVPKTCYGCRAFDTDQRALSCGVEL